MVVRIVYRGSDGIVRLEPYAGRLAALVRLLMLKERGVTVLALKRSGAPPDMPRPRSRLRRPLPAR